MELLGVALKQAREGRNLSISQAAAATRISARHLQSIEEGRYRDLPGGMYNRAFIRAYAEFLGLDPKPLLDRYASESATTQAEKIPRVNIRMPSEPREFRLHPVLVWMLMLILSVLGVYLSRNWISSIFAPFVPRSNPVQVATQPAKAPVPPPVPERQADPVPPAVSESVPEAPSAPPSVPEPVPAALPAPPQEVPIGSGIVLQVEADQLCWASFTVDGETVFAGNLEPGEKRSFKAASRIFLVLGNAGGVRATLNGKSARPFGKPGEVIKALISEANLTLYLETPTGQNP
jgi:cytoskeletal protein RodZ